MKTIFVRGVVMGVLVLLGSGMACTGKEPSAAVTEAGDFPTAEAAEANLSLTVYDQGTALVRDRRDFDFAEGFNEIAFSEVAASIDPTSVLLRSLSDPEGLKVLEQNYEFDLVGAASLLKKYLDQEIEVVTQDGKRYLGRLLSGRDDIILQDGDGQVTLVKLASVQEFSFHELPEGLITRPTLLWRLLAENPGPQQVELTYLTAGLSWDADYVVLLAADEKSVDLDGWVTLRNTSGTTFQDARLKLIAGDIQRLPQARPAAQDILFEAERMAEAPQVEEREFFEYHLYQIGRPVTISDNETKQVEFISASEAPAEKFFVYDGQACYQNVWYCNYSGYPQTDPSYGIASNPKVMVMVEVDTEDIGADLPRGRVRVYQEDMDGTALLIGEDTIDHTPKGEQVRLYVGDAFDIVGERIQADFRRPTTKRLEEDFEITLRNRKDEEVEVRVVEHLFRWNEWQILRADHDFTKLDSSTIEFRVKIPANGEARVGYTVRYSWP